MLYCVFPCRGAIVARRLKSTGLHACSSSVYAAPHQLRAFNLVSAECACDSPPDFHFEMHARGVSRSQICMGRAPMACGEFLPCRMIGTFVIIGRWRREAAGALSRSDQLPLGGVVESPARVKLDCDSSRSQLHWLANSLTRSCMDPSLKRSSWSS